MKKIKTWLCYKKYFKTTEGMVMVSLATDMDCLYHPRIYLKYRPSELWHNYCSGGSWYKGPNGQENAMEQAMEMFHSEFDKDNPIEINYSENNNLTFGGNFTDEIKMKEDIIECLMRNFPEIKFGFN